MFPGEAEGEAEAESGGSPRKLQDRFTPRGRLHAMDCTDIVIGMARGSTSKVYDAYTRDRYRARHNEWQSTTLLQREMKGERLSTAILCCTLSTYYDPWGFIAKY